MFCREHVVQLHRERDRLRKVGAELVVIGSGAPQFVRGFREVTGYDGPLYVDPSLASYQAAGLHRSGWRIVHPKVALNAVRAACRGAFQGRTHGDIKQQGGVLVIVPPDRVVYRHASRIAGDNAPAAEVASALERAAD